MMMADSIAQGDPLKRDHFAFGAGQYFLSIFMNRGTPDVYKRAPRLPWRPNRRARHIHRLDTFAMGL